jgi:uncharacterized membrane protein HdeD (DUF308 family)
MEPKRDEKQNLKVVGGIFGVFFALMVFQIAFLDAIGNNPSGAVQSESTQFVKSFEEVATIIFLFVGLLLIAYDFIKHKRYEVFIGKVLLGNGVLLLLLYVFSLARGNENVVMRIGLVLGVVYCVLGRHFIKKISWLHGAHDKLVDKVHSHYK